MRKLSAIAVAAACCAVFAAPASAGTTLLFNVFVPHRFFAYPALAKWADDIGHVTDGRVTMQIPEASVAPPPDQWNAVRGGLADGAFIFNSFAPASVKRLQTFVQLPFIGGRDLPATSVAYWRTYVKYLAAHESAPGIKVVGVFLAPQTEMYSLTSTPITTLAGLKSHKMWALPGTPAELMKRLGVSFVSGPSVRQQQLYSHHVVNGSIGSDPDAIVSFQAAPYCKSMTQFPQGGINVASFTIFISQSKWDALGKANQAAIMKVSGAALAREIAMAAAAADAHATGVLKKMGMTFPHATPALTSAFQHAASGIVADWVKRANAAGVDGRAVLAYFEAQQKQLEKR